MRDDKSMVLKLTFSTLSEESGQREGRRLRWRRRGCRGQPRDRWRANRPHPLRDLATLQAAGQIESIRFVRNRLANPAKSLRMPRGPVLLYHFISLKLNMHTPTLSVIWRFLPYLPTPHPHHTCHRLVLEGVKHNSVSRYGADC